MVISPPEPKTVPSESADEEVFATRRRPPLISRSNSGLYIGGLIIVLVVAAMVAPSVITPGDPMTLDLTARLLEPGSPNHVLGTDPLGHDVWRLIVYGARPSVLIALVAVTIGSTIGVTLGLVSGYLGGWIDAVIMRWTDIQLAFPFILLALVILSLFGNGVRNMILVLALGGWMDYARVVRSQVLSAKEQGFVIAAVAVGAGTFRVLTRHILPSVLSSVIVLFTLNLSINILFEAALTFLGLGISPETPTWGGMLSDGQVYLSSAWWIATFPGLAIMITALGINILGDWLRDTLDPRLLRGGRA
jgi:peptide/nickel transport system permease protein